MARPTGHRTMAANALMIWRAFRSSRHPAARFTREVSWHMMGQAVLFAAAIAIALLIVEAVH